MSIENKMAGTPPVEKARTLGYQLVCELSLADIAAVTGAGEIDDIRQESWTAGCNGRCTEIDD